MNPGTFAAAVAALLVAALLAVTAPSPIAATGGPVLYSVSLTFDDGGTASGTFVFDPDIPCEFLSCHTSGAFSQISITVSPWLSPSSCASQFPDPRTYGTGNLANVTENDRLAFAPNNIFWISFDAPLGATGQVGVTLSGLTYEASGAGCTRYATAATVTGSLVNAPGTTTTVPEPPEPTVPEPTTPESTLPESTTPESTLPATTTPETTAPATTTPETTVPATTTPASTTTAATTSTTAATTTTVVPTVPPPVLPSVPTTAVGGAGGDGPITELPETGNRTTMIAAIAALFVAVGAAARRSARPTD